MSIVEEAPICVMCMEKAICRKCTLVYCKEKHQEASEKLEKYLADREPNDASDKLISLSISVAAAKGCIETREKILGIS